jgi:hypothetical protein
MAATAILFTSGMECAAEDGQSFEGDLRPGKQVPPVTDLGQHGTAGGSVFPDSERIYIKVVSNMNTPGKIQAGHIHLGAEGANGGVLFNLGSPNLPTGFDRNLAASEMTAVGTVDTWDEFLAELRAGNVYVNVHTVDHPDGEIRGQLSLIGS